MREELVTIQSIYRILLQQMRQLQLLKQSAFIGTPCTIFDRASEWIVYVNLIITIFISIDQ